MSEKRQKTNAVQPSPALARQKSGTPGSDKPGAELPEKRNKTDDGVKRWHQAFATTDTQLGAYLRLQAMLAAGGKPVKDDLANRYFFAAVHSLGARDGLEALLAVQMVGVHSLAMKFLAIAAVEEQTSAGIGLSTNRTDRLLWTFALQVETLKKYRSKGEQHCIVEHVQCTQWRPSRCGRCDG
jgi:hypothetical protein